MPSRLGLTAIVLVVAAAAAGAAPAAAQTVSALSGPNRFSPAELTVTQGQQVTFANVSGTHNVHFDDGSVDFPGTANSTLWQFAHLFGAVGDFRYYCEIHGGANGVGMSGIVHVVAAPGNPPPVPPAPAPPGSPPTGPGTPPTGPGAPPPTLPLLTVTLKLSDRTPLAGKRVRVFGVVRPARDGRKVQIQKRLRNGSFKTIATTRLRDAGAAKSIYSLRLRLSADTVLRARVAGDDEAATGLSHGRKLDVHSPA
jgi:plastocyanin